MEAKAEEKLLLNDLNFSKDVELLTQIKIAHEKERILININHYSFLFISNFEYNASIIKNMLPLVLI